LRFALSYFGRNDEERKHTVEIVDTSEDTFDRLFRSLRLERLMDYRPECEFKYFTCLDNFIEGKVEKSRC